MDWSFASSQVVDYGQSLLTKAIQSLLADGSYIESEDILPEEADTAALEVIQKFNSGLKKLFEENLGSA